MSVCGIPGFARSCCGCSPKVAKRHQVRLSILAGRRKNPFAQACVLMLDGQLFRGETCMDTSYALNDIVITRSGSMQIIHFHIYVNGQFLNEYNADGVILSTPTGSTGYNMSAGGPIVEPGAKLLVITPICPHTLNTRSVVLSGEDEVVVEMAAWKKDVLFRAEVNFDGGHAAMLRMGDRIRVARSQRTVKIVKISQVSFLEALHKKMSEK